MNDQQLKDGVVRVVGMDGERKQGTAFWVTNQHLLTAWHVADGSSGLRLENFEDKPVATVVEGARCDRSDFALLELEKPVDVSPLRLGTLSAGHTNAGKKWRTHGFPGEKPSGVAPIGKVQTTAGAVGDSIAIELAADALAAGEGLDPSGLSGAPVVVDGSVVGLLRWIKERSEGEEKTYRIAVGGLVYACPMTAVLANEECEKRIGAEVLRLARDDAIKRVASELETGEFLSGLARALRVPSEGGDIDKLLVSKTVFDADPTLVIQALQSAADPTAAGQVLSIYLPHCELCWPSVRRLRMDLVPGRVLGIEAATYAYSEILLAGVDQRPCLFTVRFGKLVGKGMVANPIECGSDIKGEEFVQSILQELEAELGTDKPTIPLIKGALESLYLYPSDTEPPRFIALHEEQYKRYKTELDDLAKKLDCLRIIVLSKDESASTDQSRLIGPVFRLYRGPK